MIGICLYIEGVIMGDFMHSMKARFKGSEGALS